MHGRLKVRTSAEEAARKQKERDAKAKAFRAGMEQILAKKERRELDAELLELTGRILAVQPDITLLWNLRRQCVEAIPGSKDLPDGPAILEKELRLTEMCLLVNPKSYGAWHHRCWMLEFTASPDWQQEVELCTKYLKMDERNFHCWDYRRFVVAKAGIPPEKELDFCTVKIENNFSNYSSWHYRSKLLPILFPHQSDSSRPISEDKLKEELELVLTAAFTDPNDSSAWFYQRWLLGNSQPELDIAAFRWDTARHIAVVSFTRPVNLNHKNCKLTLGNIDRSQNWQPATAGSSYDVTWINHACEEPLMDQTPSITVTLTDEQDKQHSLEVPKTSPTILFAVRKPKFGTAFGDAVVDVLKAQLSSCEQLLEFEPDSKWTLLTAALLSRAIDREANHAQTIAYLGKLKDVDPMRAGYYRDLIGKWGTELRLGSWIDEGRPDALLDLSGLGLGHVAYEQYLAVAGEIDLRGNELAGVGKFGYFVFCEKLKVTKGGAISGETESKIKEVCECLKEVVFE